MYKNIKGKKFGRRRDQRKAFLKSLAVNLILKEQIKTTKVRAKEAASLAEKLVTKAKRTSLASRRSLAAYLPSKAVKKLVSRIAPRFLDRNGGYTRVIRLGQRGIDGAEMAIVQFIDYQPKTVSGDKKKAKTAKVKQEKDKKSSK